MNSSLRFSGERTAGGVGILTVAAVLAAVAASEARNRRGTYGLHRSADSYRSSFLRLLAPFSNSSFENYSPFDFLWLCILRVLRMVLPLIFCQSAK